MVKKRRNGHQQRRGRWTGMKDLAGNQLSMLNGRRRASANAPSAAALSACNNHEKRKAKAGEGKKPMKAWAWQPANT